VTLFLRSTTNIFLFMRSTTNIFAHNIYFCALVHKLWEYLPKRTAILIAFAVCAAQLASAGVVPEARHVAARAHSYVVNEVREAVKSMLIKL
jgi:hypothetical protein